MTAWLAQIIELLIALGLLGVGLGVARPAHSKAGWVMAASGALQLISFCCVTGVRVATEPEDGYYHADGQMMAQGFTWLGASVVDVVAAILAAVALIMIARGIRRARAAASPPG